MGVEQIPHLCGRTIGDQSHLKSLIGHFCTHIHTYSGNMVCGRKKATSFANCVRVSRHCFAIAMLTSQMKFLTFMRRRKTLSGEVGAARRSPDLALSLLLRRRTIRL